MVDKTIPDLDAVATPVVTDITNVRQAADTEDRRQTRAQARQLLVGEQYDGTNANSGALANVAATGGVPSVIANKSDPDTGLGWPDPDALGLVAGGVQGWRLSETANQIIQATQADFAIVAFATGGQALATPLTSSYNTLTTVATAGDSVLLPALFIAGTVIYIKNNGAEAADVFPASGDDLGAGANTAVSVDAGASLQFIATVANATWTQLIVAPVAGVPTTLVATDAAGPSVLDEAASQTNPTIIPNRADDDTGVGSIDDVLSLISGGLAGLDLVELNSGVVQVPSADVSITAAPGGGQPGAVPLIHSYNRVNVCASFNDSVVLPAVFAINTVIHIVNDDLVANRLAIFPASGDDLGEGVDTLLSLPVGASVTFIATGANTAWRSLRNHVQAQELLGIDNNGPAILDQAPTTTAPNMLANKGDTDTGLGWGGDTFVAIAGGVLALSLRTLNAGTIQAPSASLTITAFATGGQGSAVELIDSYTIITVCATAGDSVRLPDTWSLNSIMFIKNEGAAACDVFPSSGDDLGQGTDVQVSLPPGESIAFLGTAAQATWTPIHTNTLKNETITADNVSQTQASGTTFTSRLVTVISVNANDSITLPSVFTIGTIVELNMPDDDEDDATCAVFPALGDDLGAGVNAAFTLRPHENVMFQATVADSTWARLSRAASSVAPWGSLDGGGVRDVTGEEDNATLNPRASQPGDGIGSGNPGEVALVAASLLGRKFVNNGTGILQVEPTRSKGVTAFATGGQTNAVELLESYNVVTIVGTAADSVKFGLVFAQASIIQVTNLDATEAMDLFPGLGDDLGLGVNVALSVAPGETVKFIATVANSTWAQLAFVPNSLLATNAAGPQIADQQATSVLPTLIPNRADPDTGVSWGSADNLSFVIGALECFSMREVSGGVILEWGNGGYNSNATAFATGGEAGALSMFRSYNRLGTVATAGDSVKLVSPIAGGEITIFNNGAEAADVFPLLGDDLGQGVDVAERLPPGASVTYFASVGASAWTRIREAGQTRVVSHNDIAFPSIAFGDGDTGLTEIADDQLAVVAAGNEALRVTSAANILTFDFDAGDNQAEQVGALTSLKSVSVSIPGVAAATLTASSIIPAGAFVVGITGRIETTYGNGSGLTAFNIGDGVTATRWGTSIAITGDTTVDPSDADANIAFGHFPAANDIVLTSITGDFEAVGTMDIIVHYFELTPATA